MSRGARRRSGRGGKRRAGQKQPRLAPGEVSAGGQPKAAGDQTARSRRRRRGGSGGGLRSILDTMAGRPGTLKTLPPDGIVLEELIADLEAEYGAPATPQEYRLIVKVASVDERAGSAEDPAKAAGEEAVKPQSPRRRRRGNRRQGRRKEPAANDTPV